jgi:hypothetical protein
MSVVNCKCEEASLMNKTVISRAAALMARFNSTDYALLKMAMGNRPDLTIAATLLGHRGGSVSSPAKAKTSRENGKRGGRPRQSKGV